ncbi:MAG: RIP metalloprotease RseP, partial [Oxalobacteraceae bacterium]
IDKSELSREFTRQNVWKRIAIVAAGPLSNFALAIVLMAALFMHGVDEPSARLRAVAESTDAYRAGVRGGETVVAVNGSAVRSWSELRWQIMHAAVDKTDARLDLRSTGGGAYSVVLPASVIGKLDVDSDVMATLGLDLWRPQPRIDKVIADGAGQRAGLQAGDLVLRLNGAPVVDGIAFIDAVRAAPGRALQVEVQRAGAPVTLALTPEADANGRGVIKAMVAQAPEMVTVSSSPFDAIARGAERTWETSTMTLKMIGKMITGEASLKNVTGPITIADYAGQTARIGLVSYLQFIAFISISLGVMNLLPIPVLDGGHLLYYSLEVLTGRPVSVRVVEFAQRAGVGLLFMLMALAVFNDLGRLL